MLSAIQSLRASTVAPPPAARTEPWWSIDNAMTISTVVLVFGLLVILLATYLIKAGKNTEAVLRIFGTILILMMAVFLVVAGYSDTQVAPVMGLLERLWGIYWARRRRRHEP